ncbi:MAG: 16S rRNA (cytosine(1402)-N(4))-methyltransferase RsmH [bacterium]
MKFLHQPVMVRQVLHWLAPEEGDVYVDCTIGTGGHSKAILEKAKGRISLVGIDRDEETLKVADKALKKYQSHVSLVKANFKHLPQVLREKRIREVGGILYDLGLSSFQLKNQERGFSFRWAAPLDMRVDRSQKITAAHLVNSLSVAELEDIFLKLGEERWARRVAEFMVRQREKSPLKTTSDLVEVVRKAIPSEVRKKRRIHFATKIFQALRIQVNQELENIKTALPASFDLLRPGGRVCVISYHSLEDRIVKREFSRGEKDRLKILTKKVVKPSLDEILANPSARSARLRAAQRLQN